MIYSEAQLTIKRQQTVVDGVRTRASAIFAAATLATSFLGAQALTRSPKLDGLAWLAIGAFAAIFASVGYVLWPRPFRFVLSARVLIADHFGKTTDALAVYLAEVWEKNYDSNQVKVDRLFWAYRAACGFLALEVVAWLIRLGRG